MNDQLLRATVFLGSEGQLLGTGFLVAVSAGQGAGDYPLIVTAGHVVRPFASTFVRVVGLDGAVVDLEVQEWVHHPSQDVAVAAFPEDPHNFDMAFVPDELFVDRSPHVPMLGEELFFVGLLGQMEAMGASSTPMVRGGTLGALDQREVPMLEPPATLRRLRGHLIDCRSFGGFSGAPCFMRLVRNTGQTKNMGLTYPESHLVLLGMVGGHFDHRTSVHLPDGSGKLSVPTSAGVGVVYPIEVIREAIEQALES